MDEEQENSYKSESTPKYHARETALEVAELYGASVVLGSATPSWRPIIVPVGRIPAVSTDKAAHRRGTSHGVHSGSQTGTAGG